MTNIDMKDEKYMRLALKEAEKAREKGEVPVGAVIVRGDEIIAFGHNTRETENKVTGHAEINAIEAASEKLKSWRLDDCILYVTLEPCPMCAGAIFQSRLKKVVYGADDEIMGCLGTKIHMFEYGFGCRPAVKAGVLKDECSGIIKDFFAEQRKG